MHYIYFVCDAETAAAPVKNFTNQNILKVFQTELRYVQ